MRATVTTVAWPVAAVGAAARGRWPVRRAAILTLTDGDARGFGEAAPLPGFGDDDLAAATTALQRWADGDRAAPASASARFAIDTAVASLAAARAGTTLARHWGAATDPATLATAAVVDDADGARAAVAVGARALKVKLDGARDRARLVAIRAAAPTVALRADANRAWPLAEVDARLADLAGLGLAFVEEPAAGLGPTLRAPRPVPIALDESLAEPDRDAWLDGALASGAVAALVLKPTVLGGVAPVRALAARAHARGVAALLSHALEGPIAFAAAHALAAAIAPATIHGLGPHPALDAWRATAGDAAALDAATLDAAALDAALARLRVTP